MLTEWRISRDFENRRENNCFNL